jgi:hypothetical protein
MEYQYLQLQAGIRKVEDYLSAEVLAPGRKLCRLKQHYTLCPRGASLLSLLIPSIRISLNMNITI